MWLLVRGRGGEVDISAEAKNLESLQPKNCRAKCHHTPSLIQTQSEDILCCIGYNKLCGIYLIFLSRFELHNGVTVAMDGV